MDFIHRLALDCGLLSGSIQVLLAQFILLEFLLNCLCILCLAHTPTYSYTCNTHCFALYQAVGLKLPKPILPVILILCKLLAAHYCSCRKTTHRWRHYLTQGRSIASPLCMYSFPVSSPIQSKQKDRCILYIS